MNGSSHLHDDMMMSSVKIAAHELYDEAHGAAFCMKTAAHELPVYDEAKGAPFCMDTTISVGVNSLTLRMGWDTKPHSEGICCPQHQERHYVAAVACPCSEKGGGILYVTTKVTFPIANRYTGTSSHRRLPSFDLRSSQLALASVEAALSCNHEHRTNS